MTPQPGEVIGAVDNAIEGAIDGVRQLETLVPLESPAFGSLAALVGSLTVAQTQLHARVVPAVRALEPDPPAPPGDPRLN